MEEDNHSIDFDDIPTQVERTWTLEEELKQWRLEMAEAERLGISYSERPTRPIRPLSTNQRG